MNSVYQLNRGVGAPLEFKGLKAQYIGWYAAMLLILLVGFTLLYFCGVPTYGCAAFIAIAGTAGSFSITRLNKKFGRHGMLQLIAKRKMPHSLRLYTRKLFY